MGTYSLEGLADFILQLFDQESEDEIWQTWLHKEYKDNYEAFKKKYLKWLHHVISITCFNCFYELRISR